MTNASRWIWHVTPAQPDEYCDFRIPFTTGSGNHLLKISCDSDYALRCNGELIAFGQYPDYPDYKVYDEIPLDEHLRDGQNELLITVWYYGIDSQTYVKKPAGLRYELCCGNAVIAVSSETTLCRTNANYIAHRGENITFQLGLGFAYDSRPTPGEFIPAQVVGGLPETLVRRPIRKTQLHGRMPARVCRCGGYLLRDGDAPNLQMQQAALTERGAHHPLADSPACLTALPGENGVFAILDMGEETCGFLDIDIDVPEDCRIIIGWGEHLTDGRCRTDVRNFCCEYHAHAGRNRWMNPLRRLGCRYVQLFIPAASATVHYAGIRPVLYPLNEKPFSSGNLLRDTIYETCVRTLRHCMHDHYEDCPWREQALYTLDSRNQMLCGYYAFGETEFPRACLELISHGLRPDGLLALCYPAGVDFPIPAFSLVYFIQMREYLDHSGDVEFLRAKYGFLQRLMQRFLDQPRENGLIENFYGEGGFWNFYEWSDGMSGRFNEQQRSIEVPLNAFLSLALQHLAYIAEQLGHPADALRYRDEAAAINRALRRTFFDASTQLFASFDDRCHGQYSVLTNSLCLLCGAAEGVDKRRILTILCANGAADTGLNVTPNTLSMNCFRFDALLHENREKYAPAILDEIDRVYLNMLQQGATTFWETALGEADFDRAGSLCHGWSALPVYYYATLLK